MNVRGLSHKQLREIRSRAVQANHMFLFFKRNINPLCGGTHLETITNEIARRRTENVKIGETKILTLKK